MERIWDTIGRFRMIGQGDRVLAAVSGGADSVCMLRALVRYRDVCPFGLYAAHIEHGIRGKESRDDALFVARLCEDLGIPCEIKSCDVPAYAEKSGLSMEEAARELRYRLLEEIRRKQNCDVIAAAHHAGDQAETVLWNLVRGTGPSGLAGIQPVRDRVIRPMLYLTREDIEEILSGLGQNYRTDSTNLEVDFTRNRIRKEVLPYFREHLNARAPEHIAAAADRMREMIDYIASLTEEAARGCVRKEDGILRLDLAACETCDPFLKKEILRYCILQCRTEGRKDIGGIHIRMLEDLAGMSCGKQIHLPGRLTVRKESGCLLFLDGDVRREAAGSARMDMEDAERNAETVLLPRTVLPGQAVPFSLGAVRGQISRIAPQEADPEEIFPGKKYTKCLSCDKISDNVCFRHRQTGDYIVVNDRGNRSRLKNYLINSKIPVPMRDRLWLLADGSHILWVVGYRISEAVKVEADTKEVLRISLEIPESL